VRVRETKSALTTLCTRKYEGERSLCSGKNSVTVKQRVDFLGMPDLGGEIWPLDAIRPQALRSWGRYSDRSNHLIVRS